MSVFDGNRLSDEVFKLDVERMRRGWYSDKYFANISRMLSCLSAQGYIFAGKHGRPLARPAAGIPTGDLEVEMQWFTRRAGTTVVVGVDKALAILRHCTGVWEGERFLGTWDRLEVEAVHDGSLVESEGDPLQVRPVLRVRGRYRDFALLETPTLGVLTRGSRVATNVYESLIAAGGKPVLFFPARFDAYEVQAADGYAYNLAVQRFNRDFSGRLGPFVSTDAQGDWWGGAGSGTVAHAAIACFLGDTAEAMWAFAATLPPEIPRIALVDFNNDSVGDSLTTLERMFSHYRQLIDAGDETEARRFVLFGVRLDTSSSVRDVNVPSVGDANLDLGVSPRLVLAVRQAIDYSWEGWSLPQVWRDRAREYCRSVKIVVSGGFTAERIRHFEHLAVPADIYAVGSSLFANAGPTVTDYTADVVRVRVGGDWIPMAKVGRAPGENPELERVR
ncbi:MAG: nicotinate phosphoribosyltransferase [Gammaproteobacteria bacterium RBG_16_66_13]|nr:MAG: nicotinate phosphoribosyltransferase [Gammaproteobacteria bacterium RBG_16_66_13]